MKIIERILPVESSVLGDEQFKLEVNGILFLSFPFFWCCYSMRFFVRIRRINVQREPNAKWAVRIFIWMCLILLIDRKVKATITSHRPSRSNACNNIYVQIFDGGRIEGDHSGDQHRWDWGRTIFFFLAFILLWCAFYIHAQRAE